MSVLLKDRADQQVGPGRYHARRLARSHGRRGAGRRGLLRMAAGPTLAALAGYAALLYVALGSYQFNPTGLLHLGSQSGGEQFWRADTLVEPGLGYDGRFFFYLAHDPLLRDPHPESFLDHPAYRYARILYPAVSWSAALGRPELLPWAMLAVSLLAAIAGTIAAVDVLRSVGSTRWLALGYAFSPAIILGLIADLSEPLAFALVAAGVALFLRRRHGAAGAVLAVGALAREVSVLVPLGFALHAAVRRAWRQAASYAAPLVVPIGWNVYVWARFGGLTADRTPRSFDLPLSGAIYRAGVLLDLRPPLVEMPIPDSPWSELAIVVASVALILGGLAVLFRRRDVFALQLWLQSAAVLCSSAYIWVGLGSYARVLGLLYLFHGLVFLTRRRGEAA
ncbi:MAG: hypothetical protein IT307_18915 [Chloroflexi bacterium]|nr:hypothetical protein [Chloroflexota bacterium]